MMTAPEHSPLAPSPVAATLMRARELVTRKWEHREGGGHRVDEERLTDWLLDATETIIQFVEFNRRQEGRVGADWLWWFVQDDGVCFGLLVQAKKLNGQPGRWRLDLAYPKGSGRQMANLLSTADRLVVPAAYVVYFGTRQRRPDISCDDNDPPNCRRCERASIALLPVLVAREVTKSSLPQHCEAFALDSYREAVPLDDLGLTDAGPVRDLNLRSVGPELHDFLLTGQRNARAVAKRIFRCVSDVRRRQFSAALMDRETTAATGAMFKELPADPGHFGVSYFDHVLRGLRHSRPDYLTDELLNATAQPPPELEGLAGIAVVHV